MPKSTAKRTPPQRKGSARLAPVEQKRHGLLRILLTIALMTAAGAALGVLAAHLGH